MRRYTVIACIVTATILTSCARPRLVGVVNDVFGKPLSGAEVAIENSGFRAVTASNGRYTLPFAPGALTVLFSSKGYTSEKIQLTISEKTEYPVRPVVLYPIPDHAGVYYIGQEKLVELTPTPIRRNDRVGGWSADYEFYGDTRRAVHIPKGTARFIDAFDKPLELARIGADGVVATITYHLMTPEAHYDGFAKAPKMESQKIGPEQLLIRSGTIGVGSFAWVQLGNGPVIGSTAPNGNFYPFVADGAGSASSTSNQATQVWQQATKDMRAMATAVEAYATDWNHYPQASTVDQLESSISPTYIRIMPKVDPWGSSYYYKSQPTTGNGQPGNYVIASAGADRKLDADSFQVLQVVPQNPKVESSSGADIIYQDGHFVQVPAQASAYTKY